MLTVMLMIAFATTTAHAQSTVTTTAGGVVSAPALEETRFRGKLYVDQGLWKYGHITLTDATIVVETRHGPFKLITESIELDALSTEFKAERGLFRGNVKVNTNDGDIVRFRCPARQTKALTAALKERALARKRLAPGTVHRAEDGHPASSSTTTTTTTTTGK